MTITGKHFQAIAAMSENRVIGRGADIPWHLPEDFQWFKQKTMGHVVVMGRKTFESIGRPLPKRETIVVSRSGFQYPGVRTVSSIHDIDVNADARDVFICGGAQIYAEALPYCSDLFLTHVKRTVTGDIIFPPFEAMFRETAVISDNDDMRIVWYTQAFGLTHTTGHATATPTPTPTAPAV
jgi:dihydrofolate reductase